MTRWTVVERLSWSRSFSGVRFEAARARREILFRLDVVLLLEPLDLLLDLLVGRDDVELPGPVLEERLVHQLLQGRFPHVVAPAPVQAGRGLSQGGLGPLVELRLRHDAGVDVDEDPVDDLPGRRAGREGEKHEKGGAEGASGKRHGAESSENRAAPPT